MPSDDAVQPAPQPKSNDPLHGKTLEAIVNALQARYGWAGLGERIPLRCFTSDPSLASSLKFLRKTPWAREKVESLYRFMLRETRRQTHHEQVAGGAQAQGLPSSASGPPKP